MVCSSVFWIVQELLLPTAYIVGDGRLCFQSVHIGGRGGGTPSPSLPHSTSTGPMFFLGGTPSSSRNTFTGLMPFPGGTPVTGPRSGQGEGVPHDGGNPFPWPGQDGGLPSTWGTPLLPARDGVSPRIGQQI